MKTKEEIEILRADALAGDSGAQNDLGCAYYSGDGVTKDLKEAFKWFEKAASQRNKDGLYQLGRCYHFGIGVSIDIYKAIELYKDAATGSYFVRGNGNAANILGSIYENGYQSPQTAVLYNNKQNISPDPEEAFYWYYKGSCLDEQARFNWARCFEQGIGTPRRLYRAYAIYSTCKWVEASKRLEILKREYNPLLDIRLKHIPVIGGNPFRILGVWCNATEREIRANRSRLETSATVGKTVTLPSDHILPCNLEDFILNCENRIHYAESLIASNNTAQVNWAKKLLEHARKQRNELSDNKWLTTETGEILPRNLGNISQAIQKIATDEEKIKYSLFWFWNYSPEDRKAIELLMANKWYEAEDVWKKCDNFSAHINRSLMNWYSHSDFMAIKEILELVHSERERTAFIAAVTGGMKEYSETEVFRIYWDTLFDFPDSELSLYDIYDFVGQSVVKESEKDYTHEKTFDNLKAPVEKLLMQAERQEQNDFSKTFDIYNHIIELESPVRTRIIRFVGEDYYRYKLFCNRIAESLLVFAIHYNNDNKDNWDAPSGALYLAKQAYSIAVDVTLRERCKKNIDIFKNNANIAQTKKAIEVIDEKIKKIDGIRITFSEIETTLKSITAYLDVVRDHAGKDSAIYLNESSRVVNNILNRVIDICNYSKSFFTDSGAAPILKQLQKMDMTSETRQRLERNIKTLSGNLSSVLGESAWDKVKDTTKQSNLLDNLPDADIQIKAPKKVIVGDKFEVKYTIKGKIDKMESPKTSNLTLVGGPSTSSIESVTYGHIKSFSTVFSFTFQANSEGIATLGAVSCVVEGKRLESHNFIIQVQKGTTQQQTKALGIEEQEKQDKKEEDLWLACSKSKAYEIYLQQFPNGKYRLDATNKIKAKAERRFWLWTGGIILIIAVVCLLIFIN